MAIFENPEDETPPSQPSALVVTMMKRGILSEPNASGCLGEAENVGSCSGHKGSLVIGFDPSVDETTSLGNVGYLLESKGDIPQFVNFPQEPILVDHISEEPLRASIRLQWDDAALGREPEAFRLVLQITPVDEAGNPEEASETLVIRHPGTGEGCSTVRRGRGVRLQG